MSENVGGNLGGNPPPPCPDRGARLFAEWTASHLPANVRDAYGHRFVYPVHHRLARLHPEATAVAVALARADIAERQARRKEHRDRLNTMALALGKAELPEVVPDPPPDPGLPCSGCECATKNAKANCLIRRFRDAHRCITIESLADWYTELSDPDARDVLAFIRAESWSDPLLREAQEEILSRQEGRKERKEVTLKGARSRGTGMLRHAFMLTAMAAVHEVHRVPLMVSKDPHIATCAARAAHIFGLAEETVSTLWRRSGAGTTRMLQARFQGN